MIEKIESYFNTIPAFLHSITGIDINILETSTNIVFHGLIYFFFIAILLRIIAFWKIFLKCGEKGWKAIIPIYNLIIFYKISGLSPWFILIFLIYPISFNVAFIVQFLFSTYLYTMLARKFDKGVGFTIGLILLPSIFLLIHAFGKSKYEFNKLDLKN